MQHADLRIREAMKLGFQRCVVPEPNLQQWKPVAGMEVVGIRDIGDIWETVVSPAS